MEDALSASFHESIQENKTEQTLFEPNQEQMESRVCVEIHNEIEEMESLDLFPNPTIESRVPTEIENPESLDLCIKTTVDDTDLRPVMHKVDTLYTKIKDLKKEHSVLSDEVKAITEEQISTTEIASAFELLKNDNETRKMEVLQLKRKLVEESLERKQLYNEVIDLKGNIRVFCRCRPLNQDEIASGASSVVDIDPSRETELQINSSDSKKQFKFDHVFGPADTQDAVFSQTSPLVKSVLDGFNVCIFAYGQTGTGKTFTMEGTPDNRGVNFRTLEELFRIAKERSTIMKYELFVSMLEVYNEKIRDLLVENSTQNSKKLEIKQAAEGTQEIPGLVEARAYSTDEVWELLKTGSRNRAVGSTNANELSSRSHCLFRVTVKGENLVNGQRSKSHLWLVDLAGSERVGKTEVDGERLKESQFINKSLSALGDVIFSLASKSSHIPYRNSKLTHLLQSSLGGDCKALMFVQISPSAADLGESICSLNFASRVRGIEQGPARKQIDPTENFKLKQMAEKLKHGEKEIMKLQESLHSMQIKYATREPQFKYLKDKVRDLENQLAEERKIRLQQEAKSAAVAVTKSSSATVQSVKPPLGPSRLREPLRRITNFLPSPLPSQTHKIGNILSTSVQMAEKDRDSDTDTKADNKALMRPRRVSIAVRPMETVQANQPRPKRQRASIATLRPDAKLISAMNALSTSNGPSPGGATMARRLFPSQTAAAMARRLFPNDARRKSRIFTPPRFPAVGRSKFLGSPPGVQQQAWKPKPPTAVAVQRRHFVWSPLKQRTQKNERKSLQPSRFAQNL